jgi:hydrophobic/amphiphilic exporter-1 (mainly G- bacteria), HAE1 family
MRVRWAVVALFFVGLGLTWMAYRWVPQAFVPEEDQGWFITVVQAPPGSSLDYTSNVAKEAEKILLATPEIRAVFSVMGFSFSGAAPNQGLMFVSLKPFDERTEDEQRLQAVLNRLRGPLFGVQGAMVIPFAPPPIEGHGRVRRVHVPGARPVGRRHRRPWRRRGQRDRGSGQSQRVAGLFSSFTANDPQLLVDIDRERARSLGLPINEITSAMQIYPGVRVRERLRLQQPRLPCVRAGRQGLPVGPARSRAVLRADVRRRHGAARQRRPGARDDGAAGHQPLQPVPVGRDQRRRGARLQLGPGDRRKWKRSPGARCPRASLTRGRASRSRRLKAGRQSIYIFAIGLLLVYLTLAAQYESLVLPFIILLGVPFAVLGALTAQGLRGLQNDIYCQIGLVILIGLAAKNSILIVEFAEQLRARGLSIMDAAIEASRIRLRPILMTSLALILAVLPLVFASGAGQEGRHSVGTTVVGGMLAATFLNVVIIPVFYVVVQTMRGGGGRERGAAPAEGGAHA